VGGLQPGSTLLVVTGRRAPAPRGLRIARGGLLALSSAVLTVTAHAAAGGGVPATGLTVLLTVGIAAAGTALADRARGDLPVLGALAAAQLSTHLALSVPCGRAEPTAESGCPMLLAHLVAVLLTALLLARADAAIAGAVAALNMLVPRRDRPLPIRGITAPAIGSARADNVLEVLLRRIHSRRGPPEPVIYLPA